MGRADTIKTERRRRNSDGLQGKRRRLSVKKELLDRPYFTEWGTYDPGTTVPARFRSNYYNNACRMKEFGKPLYADEEGERI